MDIIPYLIGVAMFVLVVYWSAANATAKPGTPTFGLLRYFETIATRPAKSGPRAQRQAQPPGAAGRPGSGYAADRLRTARPTAPPRLPRR